MKKIWLSALLLAFVSSLSFAEVTVLAQGGVRFDIVNNVNQGARSETSVFNKWDLSDTDVWIMGNVANGRAGGQINIALLSPNMLQYFTQNKNVIGSVGVVGFPVTIDDWDVWFKPTDYLTLKAFNYTLRSMDRVADVISELKDAYGVLKTGTFRNSEFKLPFGYKTEGGVANISEDFTLDGSDADKLKGLLVDLNFDIVQLEFALSASEGDGESNFFEPVMFFSKDTQSFSAGTRITVPVKDIVRTSAIYRTQIKRSTNDITRHVFGVYGDVFAVKNWRFAAGFTGDYTMEDSVRLFLNGIDFRTQYKTDVWGVALHNNVTIGTVAKDKEQAPYLAAKTKMGFLYKFNDTISASIEGTNTYASIENEKHESILMDTIVVYPRVVLNFGPNIELGVGVKGTYDIVLQGSEGALNNRYITEVPFSLRVFFN